MTLKRFLLASAFLLAVAPAWAAAQGHYPSGVPRPPGPPASPPASAGGLRRRGGTAGMGLSYYSTRAFTGEVVEVNLTRNFIVVASAEWDGRVFFLTEKTRLKADKGTELGGRKKLLLEDFHKGLVVKVTYWPENGKATEVRARRQKG